MQRGLHGVVRSTTAEARAVLSALVRTRLHGAVSKPVDGEAGTGEARSAAEPSQGGRGEHRDERRREEDKADTAPRRRTEP